MTQQLDQQEVALVDQVYINVPKNIEDAYRQPADPKSSDHQGH